MVASLYQIAHPPTRQLIAINNPPHWFGAIWALNLRLCVLQYHSSLPPAHIKLEVKNVLTQGSPATDIAFPAVTICTAGMNLNAVKAALRLDQIDWEKNQEDRSSRRRKRNAAEGQLDPDPEYLRSRFGCPQLLSVQRSVRSMKTAWLGCGATFIIGAPPSPMRWNEKNPINGCLAVGVH